MQRLKAGCVSSVLISPLGLHLQGQVGFTLQILGEAVVTFGPWRERRRAVFLTSTPTSASQDPACPGPAIPEVEMLSLLRPLSKSCSCCGSTLSGNGHPV